MPPCRRVVEGEDEPVSRTDAVEHDPYQSGGEVSDLAADGVEE